LVTSNGTAPLSYHNAAVWIPDGHLLRTQRQLPCAYAAALAAQFRRGRNGPDETPEPAEFVRATNTGPAAVSLFAVRAIAAWILLRNPTGNVPKIASRKST
jgi:hypothetical protein